MDWLIETIAAALISFFVPWFLQRVLPKPRSADDAVGNESNGFPWFGWITSLAVAGGVAGIVSGVMGLVLGGVVNWAIFGAMIGVVQWVYLYRLVDVGPWFALASALGWATFIFIQPIGHATWAIVGMLVGLLQWLALMGRLKGALWWVPASALAWFVAGLAGIGVGAAVTDGANFAIAWVIGWTCVGAIVGAGDFAGRGLSGPCRAFQQLLSRALALLIKRFHGSTFFSRRDLRNRRHGLLLRHLLFRRRLVCCYRWCRRRCRLCRRSALFPALVGARFQLIGDRRRRTADIPRQIRHWRHNIPFGLLAAGSQKPDN